MTALVAAGAAGQVSGRGRTMGDMGPWAPILGALGILGAGWFALRKNWDRLLLDAMQKELSVQRDELRGMAEEIKTLRADLEAMRRENDGVHGALRTAESRFQAAEARVEQLSVTNVQQAAWIVKVEAHSARLRVYAESLVARLRVLGETIPELPNLPESHE